MKKDQKWGNSRYMTQKLNLLCSIIFTFGFVQGNNNFFLLHKSSYMKSMILHIRLVYFIILLVYELSR